jgi:hypothetical protein
MMFLTPLNSKGDFNYAIPQADCVFVASARDRSTDRSSSVARFSTDRTGSSSELTVMRQLSLNSFGMPSGLSRSCCATNTASATYIAGQLSLLGKRVREIRSIFAFRIAMGGPSSGMSAAALMSQRAVRLVRRIVMGLPDYTISFGLVGVRQVFAALFDFFSCSLYLTSRRCCLVNPNGSFSHACN